MKTASALSKRLSELEVVHEQKRVIIFIDDIGGNHSEAEIEERKREIMAQDPGRDIYIISWEGQGL